MQDKALSDRLFLPLVLIWGLWPIATFSGGRLFAPYLFVCGLLFGWKFLRARPPAHVLVLGLFLLWICLSAIWAPEQRPLISGSLIDGTFAIQAAQVRFLLTAAGVSLFVAAIVALDAKRTTGLMPVLIGLAVLAQMIILIWLATERDAIMLADGEGAVLPSPQSVGRNANLLAMALPLLLGLLVDRRAWRWALPAAVLLAAFGVWLIFEHDALAGLLGCALGGGLGAVLFTFRTNGFKLVLNSLAAATLTAPLLAKVLLGLIPPQTISMPLSAEQRLVIWQAALEKIGQKPVFGHGVNAVRHWDETFITRPDLLAHLDPILTNSRIFPNHVHNMPLQIWAETGAVGACLFALAAVLLGRVLPPPQSLSAGVKVAAAGIIGASLALFSLAYSAWDESFWASLALVICALIVLARQTQAVNS